MRRFNLSFYFVCGAMKVADRAAFESCKTVSDVRTQLNEFKKFIDIDGKLIINLNNVTYINIEVADEN